MPRVLYFDTFSGVSGDMTVGALLALGVPLDELRSEVAKLGVSGYELASSPRMVNGISATKFDVVLSGASGADGRHERMHGQRSDTHSQHDPSTSEHAHGGHHHFSEIRDRIAGSGLLPGVRDRAIEIFTALAVAEGHVHDKPIEDVSFHEVGAIDSIVDIVGASIGIELLGVDAVFVAPLPLGSGFVECQHGSMPVPAPATVELLKGFPVRYSDGEGELVTPTGAAIVAASGRPGCPPGLRIERVGYGAGTRVLSDRPNLLRLVLGEVDALEGEQDLIVLEANIDDSNPEIFEYVMDLLFEAGARDAWLQSVVMKKGRPAVVLSVLADSAKRSALETIVLRETSSIGIRRHSVARTEAPRTSRTVVTEYGDVSVKVGVAPDGTVNIAPEYEDCRRVAREKGVALKLVYAAASAAARN